MAVIAFSCDVVQFETVNSPSFVRRLVALWTSQDRGFDPSGSRQLPIAGSGRDQCLGDTAQLVYFLEIIYPFGGSRTLYCDW